jgi:hypothetical protein
MRRIGAILILAQLMSATHLVHESHAQIDFVNDGLAKEVDFADWFKKKIRAAEEALRHGNANEYIRLSREANAANHGYQAERKGLIPPGTGGAFAEIELLWTRIRSNAEEYANAEHVFEETKTPGRKRLILPGEDEATTPPPIGLGESRTPFSRRMDLLKFMELGASRGQAAPLGPVEVYRLTEAINDVGRLAKERATTLPPIGLVESLNAIQSSMHRSGKVMLAPVVRLNRMVDRLLGLRASRGNAAPPSPEEVRLTKTISEMGRLATVERIARVRLDAKREWVHRAEFARFDTTVQDAECKAAVYRAVRAWLSGGPVLQNMLKGQDLGDFLGADRDPEGNLKNPERFLVDMRWRNAKRAEPFSEQQLLAFANAIAEQPGRASAQKRIEEDCPWIKPEE